MVAPARGASSDVRRAWSRAKSAASSAMRRLGRTWGWSSSSSSASPGSSTRVVVFGDGDEAGENASRAETRRGARGGCLPSMRAVSRLAGFAQGETRGTNATRRAGRRYADRAPRTRIPRTPPEDARATRRQAPPRDPHHGRHRTRLARGEREPLDRTERLAALATRGGVLAPGRLPETPAARTLTTARRRRSRRIRSVVPATRVVDRRDADTRANHHLETDPDASRRADERLVRERAPPRPRVTADGSPDGQSPRHLRRPRPPRPTGAAGPRPRRRRSDDSPPPTSETSRRIFHPDSPTGTSWTNRTMRSAEGFDRLEISEKSKSGSAAETRASGSGSAAETRVPGSVRSATTSPAKESFEGGAGTRPSAPRASFDGERATFALEETRSTSGRTLGEELSATRFAEMCPSRRPAEGGRIGGGRSSDASPRRRNRRGWNVSTRSRAARAATRRAHPPRRRTGVESRLGNRSLTGTVPVAGARARSQTPPRRDFPRRRVARGRRRRRRRKREVLDGARERRRDEKVLGPVRVLGLGRERERRSGFERARPNARARGFVFDVERTRRRSRPFARVAARVARKPTRKPRVAASRSQRGV